MVRGVQLAAKRAGIKKIAADFVLAGEPFRFLSGDDERIENEWKADIRDKAYGLLRQVRKSEPGPNAPPDQQTSGIVIARDFDSFWDQIVAVYCIITTPEGEKIRRVMPRTRLLLLRDSSQAGQRSPWWGPFCDEMIVKAGIHFGMKRFPMESRTRSGWSGSSGSTKLLTTGWRRTSGLARRTMTPGRSSIIRRRRRQPGRPWRGRCRHRARKVSGWTS
jgi:hypothetical protein